MISTEELKKLRDTADHQYYEEKQNYAATVMSHYPQQAMMSTANLDELGIKARMLQELLQKSISEDKRRLEDKKNVRNTTNKRF